MRGMTLTDASTAADRRARERAELVAAAMDDVARIAAESRAGDGDGDGVSRGGVSGGGLSRGDLERIKARLLRLAERRDLFTGEDFPAPDAGGRSSRMYRIAQTDTDQLALYVQSVRDGTSAPPHEHTTWAVIVGMHGQELNRLYGACAGAGEPQVQREVIVQHGTGVTMVGEDVHSIHIEGSSVNFHCYGRALERLGGRRFWEAKNRQWQQYDDVGEIVEARPGVSASA